MSAKTSSGEIRAVVPSKEMSSGQLDVMTSAPLMTNKGRDAQYKEQVKKAQE